MFSKVEHYWNKDRKGTKILPPPKYAFWNTDVKLVFKEQKAQKEHLRLILHIPKGFQIEVLLQEGKYHHR